MRKYAQKKRVDVATKLRNTHNFSPYADHVDYKFNTMNTTKKKTHFKIGDIVRTIIAIIKGESDTKSQCTVGTFSFLLFCLFKAIGFVGILGSAYWGFADIVAIVSYVVNGYDDLRMLCGLVAALLFLGLVFIYSVIIWGAANEIEKENDKNFVLAVFSGVVSFAALIIALIPLLKEVS